MDYYGPKIVDAKVNPNNFINNIQFHKFWKSNDYDSYQNSDLIETNNIKIFGDINKESKSRKKEYKKFLYRNKNKYHNLDQTHLDNLVKLLNNSDIKDIPKTFKIFPKNQPFYPSNYIKK